jgi:hypothetical protein
LPFVTKAEIAFEGARDMSPRSRKVGIGGPVVKVDWLEEEGTPTRADDDHG